MKKIIMALTVLGLMAASSMAAISYVTGGSAGLDDITTQAGSQDLTLSSFGAGSGNYVVVAVGAKTYNDTSDVVGGVTYGGAALTRIGWQDSSQSDYNTRTYLYAGLAGSASGDVVMTYTTTVGGNDYDGMSISVGSWSGVASVGLAGGGIAEYSNQTTADMTNSYTTTAANSLIISAAVLADGRNTESGVSPTALKVGSTTDMVGSYLLSTDTTTAGAYITGIAWTGSRNTRRQAMISAELIEVVPEPATVGMLGLGAFVALLARRIRM